MGTCKYCGNDAGWFSHSHKECKEKHEQGVNDFHTLHCVQRPEMFNNQDYVLRKTHIFLMMTYAM